MPSPAILAPERIHPALWRGTQLAHGARATVATGHAALQAELPGQGWPAGALTELLLARPGIGELRLLQPALALCESQGPIVLLHPPHPPHIAAWMGAGFDPAQLLWVDPASTADTLWSAEQILKSGSCSALLCWLPQARPDALRRLHLTAQASPTLFFALRPAQAAHNPSPAPLRLLLRAVSGALAIDIIKRRGPACAHTLFIPLEPALQRSALSRHASYPLDRHPFSPAGTGRPAPALAAG